MGFFDEHEDSYQKIYENDNFEEHKANFGQELVAGGAAFAGFKAFEDHQRKEGKPVSHAFAKELLVGFCAAEVDRLAQTKGADWFDLEKARHEAKKNAERMYDEHYIDGQGADQYDPNQYGPPQHFERRQWELQRDQIPEWRAKYLDYRAGKKKVKAIDRALRNVSTTPRLRRSGTAALPSPKYGHANPDAGSSLHALAIANSRNSARTGANGSGAARLPEEEPLTSSQTRPGHGQRSYGSFDASTRPRPHRRQPSPEAGTLPPSLTLPGAALDPDDVLPRPQKTIRLPDPVPATDNAFEVGRTRPPPNKQHASLPARYKSIFGPQRVNSTPGSTVEPHPRPSARRIFSVGARASPAPSGDVPLEAVRELDFRQAEFFRFLDAELDKVESFYKEKETEATHRLHVLRDQLHMMRDQRVDELIQRQTAKRKAKPTVKRNLPPIQVDGQPHSSGDETVQDDKAHANSMASSWLSPIDAALEAINAGKYGNSTRDMTQLATPSGLLPMQHPADRRDYVRRHDQPHVPYQAAKRKLKVALQEYYRGLELLKSYALLNRTAFRKINKKYDKTVNARPSMRYMSEKVNQAWFVNSDVIETHIRQAEDLYARYFERGNHKVAVGKLRIKIARAGDYTDNTFRNGLLLSAGTILGLQGLIKAVSIADLHGMESTLSTNTSYLLQIYAGYFLINLLLLLFCLACRVWHEAKINYVFIFEYDTRHYLDWRQLAELPCWYLFLLGLTMQINFHQVGGDSLYLYYPVILLGISVIVLFNPIKIFYYRSRMWLLYSLWRLLLAGLYPVEWRDFYMGDMFCSLTYSMGNIELFFCLYSQQWNNPAQCNSSHSRLLGFLAALPGVWRALQCIRRYWDTSNKFPHLLNCGKYFATILFYVTLSIYRLDKTPSKRAAFITFAVINSVYTSFWDIYYDWSLGDPQAKHPFLRKELGYKKIWIYYVAMVVDPILRFNWIPYAVNPLQLQHSAVTSFCVSLSEICRRGMWSLFRVENEHCTNVGRFRASRDVPLPYDVPPSSRLEDTIDRRHRDDEESLPTASVLGSHPNAGSTTSADLGHPGSTVRQRSDYQTEVRPSPLQRAITHVGDILRVAHAQDFERRRKPELGRDPRDVKVNDEESDEESDTEETPAESRSGTVSRSADSEEEAVDDEADSAVRKTREDLGIGHASGVKNSPAWGTNQLQDDK